MRNIEEEVYKPKTKEYLIALASFPFFIRQLYSLPPKPYSALIDWFLKNEKMLLDEDRALPTINELAKQTGIESSKVTKYLKNIYEDILTLNNDSADRFMKSGQKCCHLIFNYFGRSAYFTLGLDIIPRVEEHFNFWFIKPKNGGSNYTVKNVSHEIENNGQIIFIFLTSTEPNMYLRLLREKAYLKGHISLMEFLDPNSSLDNRLLKMYSNL